MVGAGISGLVAAWELTRAGGHDVVVLESERRAGGIIVTEQIEDFVIEGGPDGFLAGEPELPALASELGIGDRVVDQQARGTALWNGTALAPLDAGRAAALLGIDATKSEVSAGFRSFATGMADPVATLVEKLAGKIRFAQGVAGIVPLKNGWRVAVTGGSAHDADAIVLALPAYSAGRLLEAVGAGHARELARTPYLPSITVSLAYRDSQFSRPLQGAGFVVESPEQIRACTFASLKFPGRAPRGSVLLRAYLPPQDGDPARIAHAQLATILGIRGEPLWSRVFYWDRGLPRYRPHHAEQVAAIRKRLRSPRLPPMAIAGAGYDGAGVSACVRSGRQAAKALVA
ncbi:MAG TPA: FAD-dependent oxidoreductase [Gemmatimonadales bacterium]|nr:FAD-dependent oxidoreductase [Gemmatimonadales bacterium]